MNELNLDNEFLHKPRRPPPSRFTAALLQRLEQQGIAEASRRRQLLLRAASIAAVFISVTMLFAVPGVRAATQQLLELFRVKNFVAVPAGEQRLKGVLDAIDLPKLVGENVIQVSPRAETQWFSTIEEASRAAGFPIAIPQSSGATYALTETRMLGAETWQFTADTRPLERLMNVFNIEDLPVPSGLQGETLTFTIPQHVRLTYQSSAGRIEIVQAPVPMFKLPPDLNLTALNEIALRILGMNPSEAHTFAQAIDWRTTLLVPIPTGVNSFQQVTVQGNRGLAVQKERREITGGKLTLSRESMILWTDDQFVHVVHGNFDVGELLVMARSMSAPAALR
jgi:hypothetical protein